MSRFGFVTVVWGRNYAEDFARFCLASLLTPDNLPRFARHRDCLYRIYTCPEEAGIIAASESYRRLSRLMRVEFAIISGVGHVGKYRAMTQCHADFIRWFVREDCGFSIMSPDVIWADGALARLGEIEASGKRMVVASTPRLAKETLLQEIERRYRVGDGLRPIPPRELVGIAIKHPHPVMASQFEYPGCHPGAELGDFMWPVTGEGFLVRHFQLQPLFIKPVNWRAVPEIAFDADYVLNVGIDFADIHVVQDSDDICAFDFTRRTRGNPHRSQPNSIAEIAAWAAAATHNLHRHFISYKIRFHSTACSERRWLEAEVESERMISSVIEMLARRGTAPQLSRWRYVSPRFVAARIREQGFRALAARAFGRLQAVVLRRIYGSHIKIDVGLRV